MSRTDDLRRNTSTRERGGGGGGAPFVKWPEEYAWIEGKVVTIWEGKYGYSATMHVTSVSDGLQAGGKTEEGEKYIRTITPGEEVNVGLNYASLEGRIGPDDEGLSFHIAFEGWGETKAGDRFRMFAVLELPEGQSEQADEPASDETFSDGVPVPDEPEGDDGLPF